MASQPNQFKHEEPTFAFQEEDYPRNSQRLCTPINDVRAVDGGENILIKHFIQDGGKLNIRDRSHERKDDISDYNYSRQYSQPKLHDLAVSGKEDIQGIETMVDHEEISKG